jgi:hypothetical protein
MLTPKFLNKPNFAHLIVNRNILVKLTKDWIDVQISNFRCADFVFKTVGVR